MTPHVILRLADVKAMTKLSRSTIYRLENAGEFPRRVQPSRSAVGWDLGEVQSWLTGRPRGRRPQGRRACQAGPTCAAGGDALASGAPD